MNYVDHFNFHGTPAKQNPCITGSGAPTSATEGAVGMLYMDTNTGDMYKCTAVADGAYTWEPCGADGDGADVTVSDTFDPDSTDAMSGKAVAQALEQNKVTVADRVTEGSTDAVSGGAVYDMLDLLSESVIAQDQKRVLISQGTENAGKVLAVGADGNVTPQEMATGDSLPAVTADDNGKMLQVVDGAWATVAIGDSAIATYIDDYIDSALGGDY